MDDFGISMKLTILVSELFVVGFDDGGENTVSLETTQERKRRMIHIYTDHIIYISLKIIFN